MSLRYTLLPMVIAAIAACSGNGSEQAASSGSGGASSSSSSGSVASSSNASSSSASTSSSSAASSSSTSSSSSSGSGAGGGSPGIVAELKAGPWIFGWSGGLDHFSWVRFNFVNQTQGSVDVLKAVCPSCTGYWQCEGQGLFTVDPMMNTVILQLPQGCNNQAHTLAFSMFMPPQGMFFPKATLQASVKDDGNAIMAFQFPPAQCDAQFTMCGDPFM